MELRSYFLINMLILTCEAISVLFSLIFLTLQSFNMQNLSQSTHTLGSCLVTVDALDNGVCVLEITLTDRCLFSCNSFKVSLLQDSFFPSP